MDFWHLIAYHILREDVIIMISWGEKGIQQQTEGGIGDANRGE